MRAFFEHLALLHERVAHPVGLPAELDEPAVVDEPVDHRRRHLVVAEHRAPAAELEVRGDDHRLALVGVREHLEEQAGAVGVERQEPELVDHEQPRPADQGGLAVKAFLERKGYEIVDEAWQGPEGIGGIDLVAVDEDGTLVFVDATVRIGTDGFPEAHRARGMREALAATWLAGNGDDYADTPVRFDEVAMMVVKESRALLRHHVNCFGEMEPLS